ncbi:alpha/beta hydrolase [Sagittula sp. NFXS13]|uniref:alpha/beta hydrolase n=1 Tax=Sagittula sp. NFXS13 TaxID=2819095 RepID=UPI0032DE310A
MIWMVLAILAAVVVVWTLLPREAVSLDVGFDETRLARGVSDYLAEAERGVPHLRPGVEKRVVWHGTPEAPTPWAVVYVHGFSASSEELRPLPDLVAQCLGANLMFTRLKGHGCDGAAMAEAGVDDWMQDVAEALAIGRTIGDRVLVMGCSTGCTLLTLALQAGMGRDVAGAVMVSPNYKLRDAKASVLTWPGARWFLPWLIGRDRGFTPLTEAHGRAWTARYPSVAVLPMAAAVRAVAKRDPALVRVPALFVFDENDGLVDHTRTVEIAARWGGPAEVMRVETGPGDDPGHHIIAGDILSPRQTQPVAERVLGWARALDDF